MSQPSQVPEGAVVITAAEIFAEVRALTNEVRTLIERDKADQRQVEQLATAASDLKGRVGTLENKAEPIAEAIGDLKGRVSKLETKVYVAAGFCAGLGALGGGALSTVIR